MLLFPDITIQDFVGPYEVFVRAPCFEVFVVSENTGLVKAMRPPSISSRAYRASAAGASGRKMTL